MRKGCFYFCRLLPMVLVTIAIASCTHDVVVPESPEISFTQQIQPIVASNCGSSGCHDGSRLFSLKTYEGVKANVTSGDARNSKLYKAITRLNYEPMPPSGPLADQQITLIYTWIMQGAKNN